MGNCALVAMQCASVFMKALSPLVNTFDIVRSLLLIVAFSYLSSYPEYQAKWKRNVWRVIMN
jgi:hypothetical protein